MKVIGRADKKKIDEIDQRWAMLEEIAKYEREGLWRPIEELRERHRLLSDIVYLEKQTGGSRKA